MVCNQVDCSAATQKFGQLIDPENGRGWAYRMVAQCSVNLGSLPLPRLPQLSTLQLMETEMETR